MNGEIFRRSDIWFISTRSGAVTLKASECCALFYLVEEEVRVNSVGLVEGNQFLKVTKLHMTITKLTVSFILDTLSMISYLDVSN